jgi:hypothetical protein
MVSSDWLPSYIRDTRPVPEIFRIAGYFLDTPRIIIQNRTKETGKNVINETAI